MTLTKLPNLPVMTPAMESIFYPESDGKPMADNSKQFRYIVTIEGNLEILFADRPDVFVIGDMLWYPVEGRVDLRQAPDVMVAFGRPKGDRGSYLQWREANIAPQVVFEILSPGNRKREMDDKFAFYDQYGVEEYYLYDPDRGRLQGWLRAVNGALLPIQPMQGWRSPRLGIRFELDGLELNLYYPDEGRFLTIIELNERRKAAELVAAVARERADVALEQMEAAIEQAEVAREQAEVAREQAEVAREQAEAAREQAEAARGQAEAESQARRAAEARVRELEEKLRQAGLL
ncbi:MAG: Uma2 family endonuclease [Caldilineaceae bacterium]